MDLRELPRPVLALVLSAATAGLVAVVALATAEGALLPVAALVAAALALGVAFRYPRLALIAYAATIPLEIVQVDGVTTLARAAGAAFFVGYLLAYGGRIRLDSVRASGWLFIGWACLSLGWTVAPGATGASLLTLLQLFGVTIMIADATSREPGIVRPVLWSYSVVACATAVLALAAFATDRGSLVAGRAGAFAEQDTAQFAALLVPALVFLVVEVVRGDRRALAASGAALCGVAILLSGTRSAWLAIAVAVFVVILPRLRPRQLGSLLVLTGAIAIAALLLPGLGEAVVGRIGSAAPSGGAGRLDIWAVGLSIVAEHPIIGVGYGAFPAAFTADVIRATSGPGLDAAVLTVGRGSHSIVLGTAGELGLIGLVLLAWLAWDLLRRPGTPPWGAVVQAMVCAVLVQALLLDVMERKQVWLVIALAFGLDYARRHAGSSIDQAQAVAVRRPSEPAAGESVRAGPLRGRRALG